MGQFSSAASAAAVLIFASTPTMPVAAQSSTPSAEDALRQAVEARDAALTALEKANEAIAKASAELRKPASTAQVSEQSSVATKLKPYCVVNANAPAAILDNANEYGEECLKSDWKKDLSLTGLLQDDKAAIIASYTERHLRTVPDGRVRNSYHRVRFGFTRAKQGDSYPIFDIGGGQWLRGWGLTGGYEYGRLSGRSRDEAKDLVKDYLAKARRDCIAAKLAEPVTDPVKDPTKPLVLRTTPQAAANCDGASLAEWMAETDQAKYYKAFIEAVLQPQKVRALYGGVNGSIAFPHFQYVPAANLPTVPADGQAAKPDQIKVDEKTYEIRSYLGGYTTEHFALEGGLSYRRTFEQNDERVICPEGTTGFLECWNLRTEPPSELRGVVADLRAALLLDVPVLPGLGLLFTPSYEFDANRWNANGAIFFAADDEGKLTSGISVNCRGEGEDRAGKHLDKDCKAKVFVSTTFSVRKK